MLEHTSRKYEGANWRSVWALIMIGALYVSQGAPFGLAMDFLPTILRHEGASLSSLAWLPLIGLPWVLKFLWAPLLDNLWSPRLGKRRSWILPMQAMIFVALCAIAITGVSERTSSIVVALFVVTSLAAATQDTATDGLVAEYFGGEMLPLANAVQISGTLVGFFLGGPAALIVAGYFSASAAVCVITAIVLSGFLFALFWRERQAALSVSRTETKASLAGFVRRLGALNVAAIAFLTAVTAVGGFTLGKVFLVDQDWAVEQIGKIGLAGGGVTVVLGCGGAALAIRLAGVRVALTISVLCSLIGSLLWLSMTLGISSSTVWLAGLAVMLGSVGTGGMSVAAMTIASRFAATANQAGTDMTIVQSSRDFGEMLTSSLALAIAASAGFSSAFALLGAIAIITLCVVGMERTCSDLSE